MSYLEPILVHPVRRQIFGDNAAQTFYISRDCVLEQFNTRFDKSVIYFALERIMEIMRSRKQVSITEYPSIGKISVKAPALLAS